MLPKNKRATELTADFDDLKSQFRHDVCVFSAARQKYKKRHPDLYERDQTISSAALRQKSFFVHFSTATGCGNETCLAHRRS